MREANVLRDRVRTPERIIEMALRHSELFRDYPGPEARTSDITAPFDPYRDSEYEGDDRYHVLEMADMPRELLRVILESLCKGQQPRSDLYVQINRYDAGDYVLPHRDSLQQGLYMLTSSELDGLVVQSHDGSLRFFADRAGDLVIHDPSAWHWVDPVREAPRFTLVTIPSTPFDCRDGGAVQER